MIRINLLATERVKAPRPSTVSMDPGQKATLACSMILVLTGAGVGWWYWNLDRASARLSGELLAAQRETTRLKTIISQVEKFDQQKQQLQERVALIEELRKGQGAPVRILDEVSRALPEMLWLTEMKQDPTGDLTIDGRCANLNSLSDFVGNLERTGYFRRPVEIVDSQVMPPQQTMPELIKFSVKAQYSGPGAPPPPAPAAAPAPRARAR
jgi:type IV pilus assembly protein PilN